MWPGVRRAYRRVHALAPLLESRAGLAGPNVRRRAAGRPGATARHRPTGGKAAAAVAHFLKVTRSYWPGLFHCYGVDGLPRTNNDPEHLFGSNRCHERRCTGRKAASPAMVLRGLVRLVAATATRLQGGSAAVAFTGESLAPADPVAWRSMRAELDARREARKQRCRYRRDPDGFLRRLEQQLLQPALPP
jgi:hypothetical protein